MGTLKKEISITGNGLMKNKPCTVTFFPSDLLPFGIHLQPKPDIKNVDRDKDVHKDRSKVQVRQVEAKLDDTRA